MEIEFDEMSDEQLDEAEKTGPPESGDNPDQQTTSPEEPETPQGEGASTPPEGAEAETTPDELEGIPEQFREIYQKDPKEAAKAVAKSYAELQKKLGENSEYADVLALFKADRALYEKAVNAILGKEAPKTTPPDTTQPEQDPLEAKIKQMEEAGYEKDVIDFMRLQHQENKQLRNMIKTGISQYDETQKERMVMQANRSAIDNFVKSDIVKAFPMDQDGLTAFLKKAERMVYPTGEYGNYTKADLENAFRVIHPQQYEQMIERRAVEKMKKNLTNAGQFNENGASAGTLANASNEQNLPGKPKISSQKDLEELTDEQLDELAGEKGRSPNRLFKWLNN